MADVTVYIDSSGTADNPGVIPGQTIQWQLDSGVTGPFSLDPPPNMFHGDDHPACVTLASAAPASPIYTVKHSASVGNHTYVINSGSCAEKAHSPATGTQTITVVTSLGATPGHR